MCDKEPNDKGCMIVAVVGLVVCISIILAKMARHVAEMMSP